MQVLLYFIIPIKIKWLAYLDVALLAYSMITSIMSGNWAGCVVILCSLANVLVFFPDDKKRETRALSSRTDAGRNLKRPFQEAKPNTAIRTGSQNTNVRSVAGPKKMIRIWSSVSVPDATETMNTARITCLRMNM